MAHVPRFVFSILSALSASILAAGSALTAASPTPSPTAPPAAQGVSADPADVSSIENIVAAVYDVISGPSGKKRDWARLRSLFREGARLVPTGVRPGGEVGSRVLDVEGYIERSAPFLEKEGFYEREVARRVERFGHIAHVFSTYESRHEPGGRSFARGINSIQLVSDGKRWWVLTILWEAESETLKVPPEYLKTRTE
jgi:hypothetical protein